MHLNVEKGTEKVVENQIRNRATYFQIAGNKSKKAWETGNQRNNRDYADLWKAAKIQRRVLYWIVLLTPNFHCKSPVTASVNSQEI